MVADSSNDGAGAIPMVVDGGSAGLAQSRHHDHHGEGAYNAAITTNRDSNEAAERQEGVNNRWEAVLNTLALEIFGKGAQRDLVEAQVKTLH